ncbi:hypothetical protein MJO49_02610, partial [Klebsiella pneumoniae]|nr:hypothetical protein [Klebsiella pneumoniae]
PPPPLSGHAAPRVLHLPPHEFPTRRYSDLLLMGPGPINADPRVLLTVQGHRSEENNTDLHTENKDGMALYRGVIRSALR